MRNRTRIACIAVLAAGLWACDNNNDTDAGTDAGHMGTDAGSQDAGPGDAGQADAGQADGGTDAGPADAGPPMPTLFGVRLVNMIGGLTASEAAPGGAVRLCLDTTIAAPTPIPAPAPYGSDSGYITFAWGLDYTVTVYDAASFVACPDDAADPAALVQSTITATDVAAGEFYTVTLTGWAPGADGSCSGLDPCPAIQLAVHHDDITAPASGKVRVEVLNGIVYAPGPVDVCVVDPTDVTGAPIVLATGLAARDFSTAMDFDPIAGSATTIIHVTLTSDDTEAMPCGGAPVGLVAPATGIAGTIPTNSTLTLEDARIPATYDADQSILLTVFPVGGGAGGTDPLAIPWVDAPDPADLF